MKSMYCAIASLRYHKKTSFFIGFSFIIALLILTMIDNSFDVEAIIFSRLIALDLVHSPVSLNDIRAHYLVIYISVIVIYLMLLTVGTHFLLKNRQEDLSNWRLLGFSKSFVVFQLLLEVSFIILMCSIVFFLLLIVFQRTYEFLILYIHQSLFMDSNKDYHRIATRLESSPNIQISPSAHAISSLFKENNVQFLELRPDKLSIQTILLAFSKNLAFLFATSLGVVLFTTALSVLFKRKNDLYRM